MTDTTKGMPLSQLAMNPTVTFEICIKPMTDTAKLQRPFPEKITAVLDPQHDRDGSERFYFSTPLSSARGEFDVQLIGPRFFARLLQEAEDIHHETNLTPRQLLDQRDAAIADQIRLINLLESAAFFLKEALTIETKLPLVDNSDPAKNHYVYQGCLNRLRVELKRRQAALAKHGEGV